MRTCRVSHSPTPQCRRAVVSIYIVRSVDMQGVSIYCTPSVVWTGHAWCIHLLHKKCGRAGCIHDHRLLCEGTCRVYPCLSPSSIHVQGVSLSTANSLHVQGVSLSSANSLHVQGVSLSSANSLHVQGVSLSTANGLHVQGVSLYSAGNVDMHGVCISLHRHAALYLCKVYSHLRCFKCRNYRLDCPTPNQSGIGTRGPMQSGTRMFRYWTETPGSGMPMPRWYRPRSRC